jgi:hypothetical protein
MTRLERSAVAAELALENERGGRVRLPATGTRELSGCPAVRRSHLLINFKPVRCGGSALPSTKTKHLESL